MGRELELKYRATEEQMAAIRESIGNFHTITMETTYYDTPDRRMGALRQTLRRRYENGIAVYAMKSHLSDGAHGEWECTAGSLEEALEKLSALGAPEVPQARGLTAICGAAFTRSCLLLEVEGGQVELALDEGILTGGTRQRPLREIELELKAGPDQALLAFGIQFAAKYGLQPEPRSKFARALSLREE